MSKLQYLERKPHQLVFNAGPLWSNWKLEMLVLRREENRRTRRKTLGAKQKPITKSTHICHWDKRKKYSI